MRRLFLVLDLSLLRQPGEERRQAVLAQLTVAVARLWAAYQRGGAGRHVSWGYALYDSACAELLLKPKLRRVAQALDLPAAFQETMQTDCRGAALVHLLTLLEAVSAEGGGAAPQGGAGEAPAAAAARALQSALGSSYLQKLLDMAGHDSSSGGSGAAGGRRAEGQLAVFAPGLCTAADLQHFLGAAAAADLAAAAAATGQAQQAALERLLAVAVPAAVWQRCAAGGLRVSWVAADAAGEPQLAALPALQAAVQQHCSHAAAARLADLAGECGADEFAARMALPRPAAAAEVQQGAGEAAVECWPQAAESQKEALDHLQLLLASLEGHKDREAEEARRLVRLQHRQLAKQRQHAMRPGAVRRGAAAAGTKGRALLANARQMQADRGRKGAASQPTSRHGTPEPAAASDDQQHVLAAAAAAAAGQAGGEEEEVDSACALAPEAAVAELKLRLQELLGGEEQRPPTALLHLVRSLVERCFASMLQYSSRHSRQQAAAAAGGAGDDAAQRQQPQEPLGLEGMRALLLQRVPAPVADLRRRHVAAEQPEQRRQLAGCILQELLLRLCICAYGTRAASQLPAGVYPDVEALMQCLVSLLNPIPAAGHDVFLSVVKKFFGARFPADIRRLQGELWDDELSLDFDSLAGDVRAKEAEPHEQEESGETPDCSAGGVQSGSMLTGSVAAAAAAAVGPSNLGRAAPPPAQQREASGREGTNSLHPSGGTARASGSAMSDEHSGIQGGGSAATTEVARSGAAAARTATSRGALVNLSHIRQRYNNTKQYELQVRSKVPSNLLHKAKLKHTVATSRPAKAGAAATAGGGSSRAAAAVAAATRGRAASAGGALTAAAAAAAGAAPARAAQQRQKQQPPAEKQVPDTPDSRGKALRASKEAEARLARLQEQWQPQCLLSGGVASPEDEHPALAAPGSAAAALDAVPDTVVRAPLPGVPADAAAAAAGADAKLMRSPSMRLDFGALPGAILPSQQPAEGGSTTTSPTGAPAAAAAAAAAAEGPTWLVAATRTARGRAGGASMPGVASFGAMAAAGALPMLAEPSAAAPVAAAAAALAQQEQQAAMEWEGASCPASQPEAAEQAAPMEADPQPEEAAATLRRATRSSGAATAEAPAASPRRGRSRSRGRPADAAKTPGADELAQAEAAAPASCPTTRSKPGTAAANSQPADAAPSSKRATRSTAAAPAATTPTAEQAAGAGAAGAETGSRRATRRTPAKADAEPEAPQPAAEPAAEQQAPARRTTRHTPGAVPAEQPAAEQPGGRRSGRRTPAEAASAKPAAVSSKGKKRRASEPPAAAAADEQPGAPEQQEQAAEAPQIASAEQLAGIASLFGCSRCPSSKTGCLQCRPRVAAALAEAGLQHLMSGVGGCGTGKCRSTGEVLGCAACWKPVKERLLSPAAAAAAAAPAPLDAPAAEAAPAAKAAPAEVPPAEQPSEPAASQPTPKRQRTTRHTPGKAEQLQEQQPASAAGAADGSAAHAQRASHKRAAAEEPADHGTQLRQGKRGPAAAAEQAATPGSQATGRRSTRRTPAEPEVQQEPAAAEVAPPSTGPGRGRRPARQEQAEAPASAPRRGRSAGPPEPVAELAAVQPAAKSRSRSRARQAAEAVAAAAVAEVVAAAQANVASGSPTEALAALPADQAAAVEVTAAAAAAADEAEAAAAAAAAEAEPETAAAAAAAAAASPAAMQLDHTPVVQLVAAEVKPALVIPAPPPAPVAAMPAPAAVPAPAADPAASEVDAAMATAGALSQQLEGDDAFASILAADIVPSSADLAALQPPLGFGAPGGIAGAAPAEPAAAAAAAVADEQQQEHCENAAQPQQEQQPAAEAAQRRRSSGAFPTAKRLGVLQGSAGKAKKRPAAADGATSEQRIGGTPTSQPGAASRSPLAPLLRSAAAAASGAAVEPSSPYEGAYDFPPDDGERAAAAAEPEEAAEEAADEPMPDADAASPAQQVPAGGLELGAANAASPVAPVSSGSPVASETAAAAAPAGSSEQVPDSAERQVQQAAVAAERVQAEATGLLQEAAVLQQLPQQQQQQPQQDRASSGESCPESAVPDSQLQQLSPPEVAGPRAGWQPAAGSPAATPQSRQRRLSPGGPAGGPSHKAGVSAALQQTQEALQLQRQLAERLQREQEAAQHVLAAQQLPGYAPASDEQLERQLAAARAAQAQRVQAGQAPLARNFQPPFPPPLPGPGFRLRYAGSGSGGERIEVEDHEVTEVVRLEGSGGAFRVLAKTKLVAYGFVAEQPIALDSANFVASLDCLTRVGQWQPAPPADAGEARQVPLQPAAAAPHWAGWAPELQRPQAPGAAQPHEQQLGWQAPAAAPAETARHNEAARHQQRRDSLDSFVLPQSALQQRQRMAEQEAAGQPQLQHSPAPRPRNLFDASPARPAAPGSATRGRPAQASSSQQLMAEGLMSPARLPSLNVMSAQKLGRRAPEGALPPRPPPAAAAGLQSPMRLPLTSDVKRQLQQSPAPAAQQQQRQQEQPRAGSETPQRSPRPAQALARGLPALPAEASAAVQQLLADLPVDSAPGSPSGGVDGGSPRLQYRMAAPGDVLLYCEKMTERSTGLPLLRRLLVTAVTPLSDGSPKKASHTAEVLYLARGAKLDQLELEREARLDAVALGKAGWKEKEEGVRRTHDWRVVGRVAPPTVAELLEVLRAAQAAGGVAQ